MSNRSTRKVRAGEEKGTEREKNSPITSSFPTKYLPAIAKAR